MLRKLSMIVITFWVGSLWMTGISASILFDTILDKQLAGNVAGHLFTVVSYIGIVSGLYLLAQFFFENNTELAKKSYFWIVLLMLVLVLLGQYGIQPLLAQIKADALPADVMSSPQAGQFAAWHGVAGVVYLIECLLGVGLVLKNQR
jgi:uncharacterized membrane protein YhaH (DUF805 family)